MHQSSSVKCHICDIFHIYVAFAFLALRSTPNVCIGVSDKPMKMAKKVDYFWLPFAQVLDYNGNFKECLCNVEIQ